MPFPAIRVKLSIYSNYIAIVPMAACFVDIDVLCIALVGSALAFCTCRIAKPIAFT